MRYLNLFFTFIFFFFSWANPVNYLYPVMAAGDTIYFLRQINGATSLYAWEEGSQTWNLALPTWYNPTHVQLLPSGTAFSFIDDDMIKIKEFDRRSATTIELNRPIYNIGTMQWLTDTTYICSAMQKETYGIFSAHTDGTIEPYIFDTQFDCLYPQKNDGYLYYVAHKKEKNDTAACCQLKRCLYGENMHSPEKDELCFEQAAPIIPLKDNPDRGLYVITHEKRVEKNEKLVRFTCYYIYKNNKDNWCNKPVFIFYLPKKLFFDTDYVLNESILPLIPRLATHETYGDVIYFIDTNKKSLQVNCYMYHIINNCVYQMTFFDTDYIPFLPFKNILGGSMSDFFYQIIRNGLYKKRFLYKP